MHFMHVAIIRPYIYYRRSPAAISGRECPFIEVYSLDSFRREHRKQSEHMRSIIYRNAVHKQKVFIISPTSYANAGKTVKSTLCSGKSLQCLQYIRLSSKHRCRAYHVLRDFKRSRPCSVDSGFNLASDLC